MTTSKLDISKFFSKQPQAGGLVSPRDFDSQHGEYLSSGVETGYQPYSLQSLSGHGLSPSYGSRIRHTVSGLGRSTSPANIATSSGTATPSQISGFSGGSSYGGYDQDLEISSRPDQTGQNLSTGMSGSGYFGPSPQMQSQKGVSPESIKKLTEAFQSGNFQEVFSQVKQIAQDNPMFVASFLNSVYPWDKTPLSIFMAMAVAAFSHGPATTEAIAYTFRLGSEESSGNK